MSRARENKSRIIKNRKTEEQVSIMTSKKTKYPVKSSKSLEQKEVNSKGSQEQQNLRAS